MGIDTEIESFERQSDTLSSRAVVYVHVLCWVVTHFVFALRVSVVLKVPKRKWHLIYSCIKFGIGT